MVMFTPDVIEKLRTALDWSRMEFAAALGVTENTVFKWESGERHPNFKRQQRLNEIAGEHGINLALLNGHKKRQPA